MRGRYIIVAPLFAFFFLFSGTAQAKKVYLNGIDLTNYLLVNVTLKGVTVRFDSKGNIYIEAPDYKIKPTGKTKTVTQPGDPQARSVYVTTFPKGRVPFDVEVWVNGKLVKRIYNTDGQIIEDITSHLKKGKNSVVLVFLRKKTRATGSIRVMVARGYESKGTVILRQSIGSVRKGAKDTKASYTVKFTVVR